MNKVVIYTPVEDFWYNSDLGGILLIWFVSLILGAAVVGFYNETRRPYLKNWQAICLTICATYTIKCGLVWALVHF